MPPPVSQRAREVATSHRWQPPRRNSWRWLGCSTPIIAYCTCTTILYGCTVAVNMALEACRVRRRRHSHGPATDARGALPLPPSTYGMEAPPPPLVQVLGGNVVTTAAVLACLNTADATALRRLHPALAVAVAAVPWADPDTQVRDPVRWRAALPAATALTLAAKARFPQARELVVLGGVTRVNLARCRYVTDAVVACLPPTLRTLDVSQCRRVSWHVSFRHLPALEWLDCGDTETVGAGLARLPRSLRELYMRDCGLPDTADFSHLRHLRVVIRTGMPYPFSTATMASLPPSLEVLDLTGSNNYEFWHNLWPPSWSAAHLTRLRTLMVPCTNINDAAIAMLPPSIHELDLECCNHLSSAASFAHLACLHTLRFYNTPISSATLATLPPSLVSLDLHHEHVSDIPEGMLTPDTVFPHLPALRVLNMSHTDLGDAAVASMPAGLEELTMVCCRNVTRHASFVHLAALRLLQSAGTDLSPATISACRARGCLAPVDGKLAVKGGLNVTLLVALPNGRLLSGGGGRVALWEADAGCGAVPVAELELRGFCVRGLAVLQDGHQVAIGVSRRRVGVLVPIPGGIVVWDTRDAPHDTRVVTQETIACAGGVCALSVANNGHLVAGCDDGKLRVVDFDAGAVVTTLEAHATDGFGVRVMAVLLDGRVATAARDDNVRLWDLGTGACDLTLVGHTFTISSLAVLSGGRLASGSDDSTVRLWDVTSGVCIRVLTGHTMKVYALAVLPGNRLASLSADGEIRVWDTRDGAGSEGGSLTRPPVSVLDVSWTASSYTTVCVGKWPARSLPLRPLAWFPLHQRRASGPRVLRCGPRKGPL